MDLLKRNSPVFVIGFITLALFVGIIVLSQKNPPNQPKLIQIDESQLLPEHTFILGNENAPLTLVEFSNYNCPHCKTAQPLIEQFVNENSDVLRWGFRHFPFSTDPSSFLAARAAQAAGRQGKFFEYTKILFDNQQTYTEANLLKYAQDLGLETEKFKSDMNSDDVKNEVNTDLQYALKSNISGTPTFILNGKVLNSLEELSIEIQKYKPQVPQEVLDKVTGTDAEKTTAPTE